MKKVIISAVLLFSAAIACKTAVGDADKNTKTINLDLTAKSGSKVAGTAVFTESNGEVTVVATMTGLDPGIHAVHLHEKADCSAPDATSAGGHWNPTFKNHGKWGSASYHRGDIGNFPANSDGEGTITFTTDEWCIGCGDKTRDILGKSIIIHQGADDFVTQPTGDAGGRVACSAIIK